MKNRFGLSLFFLVFLVNVVLPVVPRSDAIWNVPTSMSILLQGNINLDEYPELQKEFGGYGLVQIDGKSYNIFPIGVSLLALPQLFLMTQINGSKEILNHSLEAGKFVAATWMGIAALLVFLGFREKFGQSKALLFSLLFAFATPALSTGGRALWQQSGALLLNSALFFLLLRGKYDIRTMIWVGLVCGLGVWVRPTTLLISGPIFLFFSLKRRLRASWILLSFLPLVASYLIFNQNLYGSLFPVYFSHHIDRVFRFETFGQGLAGILISPNRGLLIWSPFLFFSAIGMLKIRGQKDSTLSWLFLSCIVAHLFLISSFDMWWGGHSVGPRLLTEIVPFFLWFAAKGSPDFSKSNPGSWLRSIWVATCILSVVFHLRASVDLGPTLWNRSPRNVDEYPERVWDWKDLQFLSGDHSLKFFL